MRSRRRSGWLAVLVILLAACALVAVLFMREYFTVPETVLPNLVGLQHEEAAAILRRSGLLPVPFVEHVSSAASGVVTSQVPEPGAVVKQGRSVSLGVNTPPADSRVPDLVGLQQADAVRRAADLNLPVATLRFEPSPQAAGRVIAQAPAGGEVLGEGRALELTISSGSERNEVSMPPLVGAKLEDAKEELAALGFRVVESLPSAVSFAEPGTVVSTRPDAGELISPSTPVVLQYSISTASAVQVPDVVGLPEWRAQLALRAAQLLVGETTYVNDASRPEGVVAVRPTGYTLPGTPILLTVNGEPSGLPTAGSPALDPRSPSGGGEPSGGASGDARPERGDDGAVGVSAPDSSTAPPTPDDGSRQVPFNFDPTHMGVRSLLEEPYALRVVVSDERGERDVVDRTFAAGESFTTTIPVYGDDAMLQTYINGVFFQAWRP